MTLTNVPTCLISCGHWEGDKRARHTVPAVKLEDAVWDALCAMLHDPERLLARFERIAQAASTEAHELTAQLAVLDEAENENRLAQKRLVDTGVRGRIAAHLLAQQEEELAAEAHEIAQRKALLGVHLNWTWRGRGRSRSGTCRTRPRCWPRGRLRRTSRRSAG